MASQKTKGEGGIKLVTRNKRAGFNYHIDERYEAGVCLLGSEVKSIRAGHVSVNEAYAQFEGDELYLLDCHINEYPWSHQFNHAPRRPRKLLLHKRQLAELGEMVERGGYAIFPIAIYFKGGRVKVEVGIGKGKKLYDKRESIKEREAKRDIDRHK
jgi:SsrA-binding protein